MMRGAKVAPLTSRIRTPRGASVVLTVPADKEYVVIIRSAVAQLGACFGYTVREISDLRLAVNEACALLVAWRPGAFGGGGVGSIGSAGGLDPVGTIECRAEIRDDTLRVTLAAPAGAFDVPDTDGLGWTMMGALVDAVSWAQDGVTARVVLKKRHADLGT
ncbi:serine/threonine-protein kinase RsbW [Catenulispora sp. MAP5-51]|uniref:ATP-binding protein n=1 Tax=Catenulispora sp. MAP5-51 TaxID=3156298 RepID=UPI00351489B2